MTTAAIVVVAFILFLLWGKKLNDDKKKSESKMTDQGYDLSQATDRLTYVSGHPGINNSEANVVCIGKDGLLQLFKVDALNKFSWHPLAGIPISSIKDISLEDATTVHKRFSAGRLLLFGPLALAMKKTKKEEEAFVIIEWSDGKFEHQTILKHSGFGAMNRCNAARNKLISIIK